MYFKSFAVSDRVYPIIISAKMTDFTKPQYVSSGIRSKQTEDALVKQDTIGPHDLAATITQKPWVGYLVKVSQFKISCRSVFEWVVITR